MTTRSLDPFIEDVAANNRAAARMWLDWQLDSLRITAGLVEVTEEGGRLMLCNRPCAAYAHFHLVRDVI